MPLVLSKVNLYQIGTAPRQRHAVVIADGSAQALVQSGRAEKHRSLLADSNHLCGRQLAAMTPEQARRSFQIVVAATKQWGIGKGEFGNGWAAPDNRLVGPEFASQHTSCHIVSVCLLTCKPPHVPMQAAASHGACLAT